MIAGIKIGPRNWKEILSSYSPSCCEVWFRADRVSLYEAMFSELRERCIPTGLHFWGILPGGIQPNFAFPDEDVRKPSLALVKACIDVASEHDFTYVNIHPGSYRLSRVNLDRLFMRPIQGRETTPDAGNLVLAENMQELSEYAQKCGVLFLVETIPAREPMHFRDLTSGRRRSQDMRNVPVSELVKLTQQGFFVCNDFCHTTMDIISDDREFLFRELFRKTKRLAPQTKLVHLNTLPPPFNGTDGHLGIRRQDFTEDVFPTREQIKQLLSLFVDRDDVWVIPEPFSDHVDNTTALEELLEEI